MENQQYANHRRFVTGYHFVLSVLLLIGLIAAVVNVVKSWDDSSLFSAILVLLLFVCAVLITAFVRVFPLKAQDRAIRAEENLRHFILTGKPLDNALSVGQITALRFASDEEFIKLATKAADEKLSPNDIKKAINHWRADHHRV